MKRIACLLALFAALALAGESKAQCLGGGFAGGSFASFQSFQAAPAFGFAVQQPVFVQPAFAFQSVGFSTPFVGGFGASPFVNVNVFGRGRGFFGGGGRTVIRTRVRW